MCINTRVYTCECVRAYVCGCACIMSVPVCVGTRVVCVCNVLCVCLCVGTCVWVCAFMWVCVHEWHWSVCNVHVWCMCTDTDACICVGSCSWSGAQGDERGTERVPRAVAQERLCGGEIQGAGEMGASVGACHCFQLESIGSVLRLVMPGPSAMQLNMEKQLSLNKNVL